jgi:hypothetical protein
MVDKVALRQLLPAISSVSLVSSISFVPILVHGSALTLLSLVIFKYANLGTDEGSGVLQLAEALR